MKSFLFKFALALALTCALTACSDGNSDNLTDAKEPDKIEAVEQSPDILGKDAVPSEQEASETPDTEAVTNYAGTYTPYFFVHDDYGGGSQWQDIELDENGVITGGGTDWYPINSSGTEPVSITTERNGSVVITISDDEKYTIYPVGLIPVGFESRYYNNVVNVKYTYFDGGAMEILYYSPKID